MSQNEEQHNPLACPKGDLVVYVTDWNMERIAWRNGKDKEEANATEGEKSGSSSDGLYKITLPDGRVVEHNFHEKSHILIQDVPPGKALLEFIGNMKGLASSLEHIPVPFYDDPDIEQKNGNNGKSEQAALPVAAGAHLLDDPHAGWEGAAKMVPSGSGKPPYSPGIWISHTERWVREANYWFHAVPHQGITRDNTFTPVELVVDLKQTYKGRSCVSVHYIEITGRYAYIPALEYTATLHRVNAYNLSCLARLAYGQGVGQTETRQGSGSALDVFTKMANHQRPTVVNDEPTDLVLRRVPYEERYYPDRIELVVGPKTEFNALLAHNKDTMIIACSGLNKKCYGPSREGEKNWQAARKAYPLAMLGRYVKVDALKALDKMNSAGVIHKAMFHGTSLGNGEIEKILDDIIEEAEYRGVGDAYANMPKATTGALMGFHDVQKQVYQYLRENKGKDKILFMAGSCVGGVVASLLIHDLLPKEGNSPLLYSYGMPCMLEKQIFPQMQAKVFAHHCIAVFGDALYALPFLYTWVDPVQIGSAVVNILTGKYAGRMGGHFDLVTAEKEQEYDIWGSFVRYVIGGYRDSPGYRSFGTGLLLRPQSALARRWELWKEFYTQTTVDFNSSLGPMLDKSSATRKPISYSKWLDIELLVSLRVIEGNKEVYKMALANVVATYKIIYNDREMHRQQISRAIASRETLEKGKASSENQSDSLYHEKLANGLISLANEITATEAQVQAITIESARKEIGPGMDFSSWPAPARNVELARHIQASNPKIPL